MDHAVLVKFFATYRKIVGQGHIDVPAPADVLALLQEVSARYPRLRSELLNASSTDKGDTAIVLVCGRHIDHLDGVHTALSEDDYVALTPLVAGG